MRRRQYVSIPCAVSHRDGVSTLPSTNRNITPLPSSDRLVPNVVMFSPLMSVMDDREDLKEE